jgi:hypothetical protein
VARFTDHPSFRWPESTLRRMLPLPREKIDAHLAALRAGSMPCPFCGLAGPDLVASDDGPRSDLLDEPVESAGAEAAHLRHLVYCPKEDRNFYVVYRPKDGLPECPECGSDFDVVGEPPDGHVALTAIVEATTRCEACDTDLDPVTYEAFDIVDDGLLGN